MAWCTDILAVYLPSMEEAQFTRIVRQLLFMETSEVRNDIVFHEEVRTSSITSCMNLFKELLH